MSSQEIPRPPEYYAKMLEGCLEELQSHSESIRTHEAASNRVWCQVTDLIRTYGVTEETKFLRAAFRGFPTDHEKTRKFIEYLQSLDEQVKNSAGETVAWLTSEEEDTSHPFNPSVKPMRETNYYLHIGILPDDASLQVGGVMGNITIPISRSVRGPLVGVHQSEGNLSLAGEIIPVPLIRFEQEWASTELNPEIDLSFWQFETPYPAVFGNEAVKELFDQHSLEEKTEVVKALEKLSSTLF